MSGSFAFLGNLKETFLHDFYICCVLLITRLTALKRWNFNDWHTRADKRRQEHARGYLGSSPMSSAIKTVEIIGLQRFFRFLRKPKSHLFAYNLQFASTIYSPLQTDAYRC